MRLLHPSTSLQERRRITVRPCCENSVEALGGMVSLDWSGSTPFRVTVAQGNAGDQDSTRPRMSAVLRHCREVAPTPPHPEPRNPLPSQYRKPQRRAMSSFILLAGLLPLSAAQQSCISLSGSSTCPGFNASSISTDQTLVGLL